MKATRGFALLTLALLLALPLTRALATNVREGIEIADFAEDEASASTYAVTTGSNIFSGVITNNGPLDADYFKITVPTGRVITAIQKTGSASSALTPPLYAGTYTFSVNVQVLPGGQSPWGFTFTVATAPDFDITTTGGQVILTDHSNFGDTLTLSEPFGGTIQFSAPGRTFSVDGGPFITGNSGSFIPFNDSSNPTVSVIVNDGTGNDTINVGDFSRTAAFPNLTINGGAGNDTVNFTGKLTFGANRNLDVNLQNDVASPGVDAINVTGTAAQIIASGTGTIDLECSRSISITAGALVQTVNGNLTLKANLQVAATIGNFTGVTVKDAGTKVQTVGPPSLAGAVTVSGRGGSDAGGFQLGVDVNGGAQIIGGKDSVSVTVSGIGGPGTGIVNRGVTVYGAGSAITSTSGFVVVNGTAGPQGSGYGIGISVLYGGKISGKGVDILGIGGGASGDANQGVEIGGAATPASIVTSSGELYLSGAPGPGASVGLFMSDAAAVGPAPIALIRADSLSLDATATISTSSNFVSFAPFAATHIDLGGAGAAGTLGLPDAILDRVTTPSLIFEGNADIVISAPITRSIATDVTLKPGPGGVRATANGTDLDLAGGTLNLQGRLAMPITGSAVDSGYPQLNVAGGVNLTGAALDLTGTTLPGIAGQAFTIIANDGSDAVTGTFANLPEGASLAWPGSTALNARISYHGGDGNDVVLTLVSALTVTNNADSGVASLRNALAYAASHAGADTVTFDSSLNGATIQLTSPININDGTGSGTIDASSLPAGITINGGGLTPLFTISGGSNSVLTGLTLTGGSAFTGGAINNSGVLTLNRCTLSGNSASSNGGAINNNGGTATLMQCTLAGNSAVNAGGIFHSGGNLTVTQCTFSGNSATSIGGAIINTGSSTFTLTNSIVAGNSAPASGADIRNDGVLTRVGANIVQVLDNSGGATLNGSGTIINAAPLLAPLDNYGGPTRTMALQPGSPARNAAVGSSITSDQRLFPIVGTPDVGAYEAGTISTNYNAYIWETLPAGTTVAQHDINSDYDGDGVANFNEYLAQTNPSLASSYLHVTQLTYGNPLASVTFPSVVGRHYTVEVTTSLVTPISWGTLTDSPINGTGNPITFSANFPGFTKAFLRVRVGP